MYTGLSVFFLSFRFILSSIVVLTGGNLLSLSDPTIFSVALELFTPSGVATLVAATAVLWGPAVLGARPDQNKNNNLNF